MRKDLGLVLDEARRNGARLPVTALVDQFYADLQAAGGSRWDTSSLIKRLAEPVGLRRRRRRCRRGGAARLLSGLARLFGCSVGQLAPR